MAEFKRGKGRPTNAEKPVRFALITTDKVIKQFKKVCEKERLTQGEMLAKLLEEHKEKQ